RLRPFHVAGLPTGAPQTDLRRAQAGRKLEDPAKLVLRAVQIAELIEVDLSQSPPGQHLRLASLLGGAAQEADRLLRIGLAQLERGASDVVQNSHPNAWIARSGGRG